MGAGYLWSYASVAVVGLLGVALAAGMLGVNRFLRPSRPGREKQLTYESGVDPVGTGWAQGNVRYFVYAYLYVIFAVDAVFLFPWATVFTTIGWDAAVEMGVFLGFIALGLVYAWRKGVLTWT
ncbi:NADH-quinone oxidoreductase subunit A [Solicola sp. PLA-1-18]|uniref:NADH-quinone oxidoreductase subunit A n=1 Tax=Solicola sp. PLA-1-18 TaxID=3380532 RepID=UPI003B7E5F11